MNKEIRLNSGVLKPSTACRGRRCLFISAMLWCLFGISALTWADRTVVRMETNFGDIVISLLADDAPKTVENFLDYVESDFYDGLIFHRVVNDPNPFVIQAGAYDPNLYLANSGNDPNFFLNPNWTKDPNFFHTPNDPVDSEADNGFSNIRGTVAMALAGGDPDSGTSQFFISLTDNSFLDAQDFTVFGEVIIGMEPNGVVDTIGALDTQAVGEGTFKLNDVPDANTPVIIQDVTVERVFDDDSAAFDDVDFLQAGDGELRTYVGQGAFSGKRFTHRFTEEKVLGVQALNWRQTGIEEFGVAPFDLTLAKDEDGSIWVFDYDVDGDVLVDPNHLLEIVPLGQFGMEEMDFKLILGDFNELDPNDPNNQITIVDGSETITERIVGFTESLDAFADFDDELLLVRSAIEPNAVMADWRWYHESQGLVLDLFDHASQQEAIDPNGDGWRFLIPDEMANLDISFKADRDRSDPSDSFDLSGDFTIDLATLEGKTLYIFMGHIELSIAEEDFVRSNGNRVLSYKGSGGTGGQVAMQIRFDKGTFNLQVKQVDLTGIEEPVRVEMAVGNIFNAGEAVLRNNKPLPMVFRQGVSNSLRVDHFVYIRDDRSGFNRSRLLKINGAIATQIDPFDIRGKEISVNWGTKALSIPEETDPNEPSNWSQRGNGAKYIYRNKVNDIRRAEFDLDRSEFKIEIRNTSLGSPTQSFGMEFELTDEELFSEEVAEVGVGTLPQLSDSD